NVRELRNLLERTILLEVDGNILKLEHLERANQRLGDGPRLAGASGTESASRGHASSIVGQAVPLAEVEREHIHAVLDATGGNKNKAAQILGIDRTTLYNKLKKYGDA
ncbi:MAG: hypothetical protein KDK78_11895, partial [Chlamydiia bacterium]|nr:hypothetical protein [Chlamydiia bacterium]